LRPPSSLDRDELTGRRPSSLVGVPPRADRRKRLRRDRLDDLLILDLRPSLVVVVVAEHAEVARHAAVGMNRDARQDLLALVQAESLHVEVGEADAIGGVRRVLTVVRGDRLRKALEVLRDLAGVSHRSTGG
jgi:hypothetical protein